MSSPYFVLQKVPFQKGILDFTMFKEKKTHKTQPIISSKIKTVRVHCVQDNNLWYQTSECKLKLTSWSANYL